jgi:hypothetical protein
MSEMKDENTQKHSDLGGYGGSPTTGQMRSVGQRRREAEEKLEHHLEEARHKEDTGDAEGAKQDDEAVDSSDVADIQSDGRLTAAERVDLIANQVIAGDEDGTAHEGHKAP